MRCFGAYVGFCGDTCSKDMFHGQNIPPVFHGGVFAKVRDHGPQTIRRMSNPVALLLTMVIK